MMTRPRLSKRLVLVSTVILATAGVGAAVSPAFASGRLASAVPAVAGRTAGPAAGRTVTTTPGAVTTTAGPAEATIAEGAPTPTDGRTPAAAAPDGAATPGRAAAESAGRPGAELRQREAGQGGDQGVQGGQNAQAAQGRNGQGQQARNAAPNPNCTLAVPPAPLSAAGLATPYQLSGGEGGGACHEANKAQSAFVEATILDPATGKLSVYHPLVVDAGTQPAVPPAPVTLPAGAVVGVWFGFQGQTLTLRTAPGDAGTCVNGLPGSPFGQFAYCGAPAFFTAANAAISAGKLTVPPLGTGRDGKPCPTTRDFGVVDQDQSDNLNTEYVALPDGRTAQSNPANLGLGGTVLTNASDNGLLAGHIDPAIGCTPFTAPDLDAGGAPVPSLALNELQAAADQAAPVATVPANDPMVKVGDRTSTVKNNLYRAGVDMAPLGGQDAGDAAGYCRNLAQVAPARLAADSALTRAAPSPDPATPNLFAFLAQRLTASWQNLGCQNLVHAGPPAVPGANEAGTGGATGDR